MAQSVATRTGKYLYAVVYAPQAMSLGEELKGINGGQVGIIRHGDLAAIVSDVPDEKLRPERRNIAAHEAVLRAVMETTTPLPFAFGVVAGDEDAVERLLEGHAGDFTEQLQKVAGMVEFSLRVTLQVPNIFEFYLERHSDLKKMRDEVFGRGQPTTDEKIALGQRFADVLEQARTHDREAVVAALGKACDDTRRLDEHSEAEVMNLACLVKRDRVEQFHKAVNDAGAQFDDTYTFNVSGPWAPHSFATKHLGEIE